MARPLKVFRTPIGFHDAYVAASSQKAALEAWGTGHNLFARGEAELVTDPALTEAPLATPGMVVRRLRGSAEEQFASLPADRPGRASMAASKPTGKKHPKSRPRRDSLDRAERGLADAQARHEAERRALADRIAALERERRALEDKQSREIDRFTAREANARAAYDAALAAWRSE